MQLIKLLRHSLTIKRDHLTNDKGQGETEEIISIYRKMNINRVFNYFRFTVHSKVREKNKDLKKN